MKKERISGNIESLKKLPDNSVDSVVTDPPYGLIYEEYKKFKYDFFRMIMRDKKLKELGL